MQIMLSQPSFYTANNKLPRHWGMEGEREICKTLVRFGSEIRLQFKVLITKIAIKGLE